MLPIPGLGFSSRRLCSSCSPSPFPGPWALPSKGWDNVDRVCPSLALFHPRLPCCASPPYSQSHSPSCLLIQWKKCVCLLPIFLPVLFTLTFILTGLFFNLTSSIVILSTPPRHPPPTHYHHHTHLHTVPLSLSPGSLPVLMQHLIHLIHLCHSHTLSCSSFFLSKFSCSLFSL